MKPKSKECDKGYMINPKPKPIKQLLEEYDEQQYINDLAK